MSEHITIASLRRELGLSQEEFAARIGLSSKGHVSIIERDNRCAVRVALKIEQLSGGRVDAASLNDEVRVSRHGLDHAGDFTSVADQSSSGSSVEISPVDEISHQVQGDAPHRPAAEGVAPPLSATPEAAQAEAAE